MAQPIYLDNTRWERLHRFETKYKKQFLTKLSQDEGWRLLRELNELAPKVHTKLALKKLAGEKIETLIYVHVLFGKVGF